VAKTIVLTGASDGIGAAAAIQLAARGHRLILAGRSKDKLRAVAERVGAADAFVADFEDLGAVRGLAEQILGRCDRIDVLANNAGGVFDGPKRTGDGFERTFQVNHLGPFLLTNLLLQPLLAAGATVVATSSVASRLYARLDLADVNTWNDFSPMRAYGNAKLANILFTKGLHERYSSAGISAVALHPGVVATNFAAGTRTFSRLLYQTPLKVFLTSAASGGARLARFASGRPGHDWESGEYYEAPGKPGRFRLESPLDEAVASLWDQSSALVRLD
jgi:NAD(P)-dependent dehydrogenase (short-subunit alcohol dehydrogenase family)